MVKYNAGPGFDSWLKSLREGETKPLHILAWKIQVDGGVWVGASIYECPGSGHTEHFTSLQIILQNQALKWKLQRCKPTCLRPYLLPIPIKLLEVPYYFIL